ncbi:class I SAM-dependent methyltransferase [Candidatus Poribacteria bacterium]|nr:class I SAM-dependent methyltransferase [Candidatus Poribacteria bacterium]
MSLEPSNDYRERIYATYVSQNTTYSGMRYTEESYHRWAKATLHRVQGWLPAGHDAPILDMGCGPGNFLYLLKQQGYTNLYGVDLSPEQIALARKQHDNVFLMDVRDFLTAHENAFDLITGFDIIEHFRKEELIPFLERVFVALRPGGRIILQTPNAESPWGMAIRYGDFTHEIAFCPVSLAHLLRLVGFSQFESRECAPYVHGVKSLIRKLLWQGIHSGLTVWNLAETGNAGSRVYTRVFIASAMKGE